MSVVFGLMILNYYTVAGVFSKREAVFMSYGGLRGTVGIALALLLSAEVFRVTESESIPEATRNQYREFADTMFGLVVCFFSRAVIIPFLQTFLIKYFSNRAGYRFFHSS